MYQAQYETSYSALSFPTNITVLENLLEAFQGNPLKTLKKNTDVNVALVIVMMKHIQGCHIPCKANMFKNSRLANMWMLIDRFDA
jgi:hypothetical protein